MVFQLHDKSILWYVKGSRLLSISARAFVSMCSFRSRLLSAVTKFLCCLHLLHSALFVSSVLCLELCPRCACLKSRSRFRILRLRSLVIHGLSFRRIRTLFFGIAVVAAVKIADVNFYVAESVSPSRT